MKFLALAAGAILVVLGCAYFYAITPHQSSAPSESAVGLLEHADQLSWGNNWAEAQPLYAKAEHLFEVQNQPSKALYAQVSQIPPNESVSVPNTILQLTDDLETPGAQDKETRLRILTIRGMLQTNYDAAQARATWQQVGALAIKLHHYELATRAEGEQGIAAFLLGDVDTAKKQVVRAWGLSKVEHDPAATVRYASAFGAGLVQIQRFKEAITFLNQAINVASSTKGVAFPTIAIYAKIDALAGLHHYDEALALANQSLARLDGTLYDAHKSQVLISRGSINKEKGDWNAAIADYLQAVQISRKIDNYRGVTDAGGQLAQGYEHLNNLPPALDAINEAIAANTHIADELYLVPRNLAIKAEIIAKMGNGQESDGLYREAIALVNVMIQHASTINIQRQLQAEMSDVYSGFFASLCAQKRFGEALNTLEQVRGRVETQALEHHETQAVHPPTTEEAELTRLNIALINAEDPAIRSTLTNAIYTTELRMSPSALARQTIAHPVPLYTLQHDLSANAVVIEYVLAEPSSYAFAITHDSVTAYPLPSKALIEADANRYRKELRTQKEDRQLAQRLYNELLAPVQQYKQKTDLIIIPDGSLHLMPFAALVDESGYVLKSHTIDVAPSSTVFELLSKRVASREAVSMPYIGVAAWTQPADTRNFVTRAISGPQRSQLVSLPDSQKEVETIAKDLPHPSTILLGSDATESKFKHLPLSSTEVVHLALHGYADLDYPDRSALIFAPENGGDDGLLQVREIRNLHLNARMVTLSACNTGVGPVGQTGVANLVNAFIEAGADTVVSTFWELEDHATEHLMADFYSQIANHKRKIDALRYAQMELLNQGLPSYYWASFQIVGDPNGTL